jgi:hypothetical protein
LTVKRLASITFILPFLLFSGGIQILVHTCGGETTVVMMPASAEDPCGCGDESPDARCCTVELKNFHLDAMQQTMAAPLVKVESIAVAEYPLLQEVLVERTFDRTLPVNHSPPRSVSATILNCTLLV